MILRLRFFTYARISYISSRIFCVRRQISHSYVKRCPSRRNGSYSIASSWLLVKVHFSVFANSCWLTGNKIACDTDKSDRLCELDTPVSLSNNKKDVLLRISSHIVLHFAQTLLQLQKYSKHPQRHNVLTNTRGNEENEEKLKRGFIMWGVMFKNDLRATLKRPFLHTQHLHT